MRRLLVGQPTDFMHPHRLGTRAFPKIVLSNVLFVLALFAAKESLLSCDVGVFWVVIRVLALGALGMLVWEGLTLEFSKGTHIEVGYHNPHLPCHLRIPQWTALGVSSFLLFVQQAALYTALYRLPSLRCVHHLVRNVMNSLHHFPTVSSYFSISPLPGWTRW